MSRRSMLLAMILSVFLPVISWGSSIDSAPNPTQVRLDLVAGGFTAITDVTNAGDGRLFVVEQGGTIRVVDGATVLPTPFLDVSAQVACCSERGLLGLAFHPNYNANRYFYVNYTYLAGGTALRSRVSRFTVSAGNPNVADAGSEMALLEFSQPYNNHNGGTLHFGPDGYLYIGAGDGGDAYDPPDNAQSTSVLLGKILRIDVNSATGADCGIAPGRNYGIPAGNPLVDGAGGACDEIWAYGLRNPWRISFDRATGDLWIADVGQSAREEIDVQAAGSVGGQNYGWDCWEGTLKNTANDPSPVCTSDPPSLTPLHEYDHSGGRCSITGGYVYRGPSYAGFAGAYFFADYCSAEMWTLKRTAGAPAVAKLTLSGATLTNPRTFGEDVHGELYVASSSAVYRLADPASPPVAPAVSAVGGPGNTVTLNWGGDAANCIYEVHRAPAPYFTPSGAATEVASVPASSALTYSDPDGTGDPDVSNYYVVRAFNCSAISAVDSNRTGEFEYSLAAGV